MILIIINHLIYEIIISLTIVGIDNTTHNLFVYFNDMKN